MPGNILNADTGFPQFTGDESSDAKIDKVMNYLYMLLEQLRYSLSNLDADNFNDAGLREIGEGIARPLQTRFENEFSKTSALIEEISNEFGSQIRLLTEWKGTASESISSLTQKADANAASITLLTEWKGDMSSSLAAVQTKASQNEAQITALASWKNTAEDEIDGLAGTMAVIEATADENGARINQIVSAIGKDGEVTFASIAAGVADDESFVKLIADKIALKGFVTFESLENDGEGAATINGNNISLISDSYGDSVSKLGFYYQSNKGNPDYEMGNISTLYDKENDIYTLGITGKSFKRTGSAVGATRLFLNGEGGVDIISAGDNITISSAYATAIGGQLYCNIGGTYYGVRIHAPNDYLATINSKPGPNKFIFCNNGIFFIDENEDPHTVWER